jgi:Acyltransferase family
MSRLRQLDGLRGCAIIFVLLWHYVVCQLNAPPGTFLHTAKSWLSFTWSGVDLFFVLSGFLITGILLDNANAANYFRTFYIRRACRILPVYMLLLLAFVIAAWALNDQARPISLAAQQGCPCLDLRNVHTKYLHVFEEHLGASPGVGPNVVSRRRGTILSGVAVNGLFCAQADSSVVVRWPDCAGARAARDRGQFLTNVRPGAMSR